MNTIEGFKGFPIVAWFLVIFFAMFTIGLTLELQSTVQQFIPVQEFAGLTI